MKTPDPVAVELHLHGDPTFSRYSKQVKELGGNYSACRGYNTTRYVTLPWTAEGRRFANKLIKQFGGDNKGESVTAIVRGIKGANSVPSWVTVQNVPKSSTNPMTCLFELFDQAFQSAVKRELIEEGYDKDGTTVVARNFVVRLGNHWLQTNDNREHADWVHDLCRASLHSKEWADQFAADSESFRVEVIDFATALANEQNQGLESVKTRWLYAFEHQVREAYGDRISKDGLWVNAHMFHRQGLTVENAVVAIGKSFGIEAKNVAIQS